MQSGIDSSRARISAYNAEAITRIDIRPERGAGESSAFFGKDGLTFRDVLDAINPLNHIPVVSELFASATEHQPSTAAKLVGGTLLGGPIGFVASLASAIFESGTGSSPEQAVVAALTGEEAAAPTQLASTTAVPPTMQEVATAASAPKAQALASLSPAAPNRAASASSGDVAVLELYGNGNSAHASYRKAQLLPYLRDVTQSKVI